MSKTIKIYEKETDLSQVILGIEQDATRARFNEICTVLEQNGYTIQRYDALHDDIPASMVLPSIYMDDRCLFEGAYPTINAICTALNLDSCLFVNVVRTNILNEANTTRLGSCCGVGQDIYLDPNEDDLWQ